MTITSYPFSNQDTTETQFSDLFKQLQDSGVVGDPSGPALKVTGDGTGMNVKIASGYAIVRGHAFRSTATETVTVAAAEPGVTRKDYVVLRLDPSLDSIVPAVVKGNTTGVLPVLAQTDSGIYEMPLAILNVRAGAPSVLSGDVVDDRRYTGTRVGVWTTATRPNAPRVPQLGLNTTLGAWEFWSGTGWNLVSPSVTWTAIQGKPTIYPTNWASIVDKPTTFETAPHAHAYAAESILGNGLINGYVHNGNDDHGLTLLSLRWDRQLGRALMRVDQNEFPLAHAEHQHVDLKSYADAILGEVRSQYVTRGSGGNDVTASRANGSDRPFLFAGTGFPVWVDSGHNFVRNTSSIRYKENVRDLPWENPLGALKLRPVMYDRIDGDPDEVGLIAEEVAEVLPEVVSYYDGKIDSVRYDLLGLALLPVVKDQQERIERLEKMVEGLRVAYQARKS